MRLPGMTLTAQELPCRLRAPQVGRSLCGSGVRRPVSPSACSWRHAVPVLHTGFEQLCRSLEAGHATNPTNRFMDTYSTVALSGPRATYQIRCYLAVLRDWICQLGVRPHDARARAYCSGRVRWRSTVPFRSTIFACSPCFDPLPSSKG